MNGSVLIAEGDPFNLRLLEELCEEAGFDVVTAGDGEAALNVIARQRPALIVLDAALTTDDGAGVLELIVSDASLASIPVLLTTDPDDEEARRRGLALGAADFVARPYRVWEVEHRIASLLRLSAAERELERQKSTLAPAEDGLDPVTHAGGAAQLRISLDYEVTRAVRYGHPLTCVVLRVANFQALVERAGEEAGRGVLVLLVSHVRRAIRGIDHLFRSDVDELVLLLPETSAAASRVVTDRLRAEGGGLAGAAIDPPARLELGVASVEPRVGDTSARIREGEALFTAARASLAPI